MFVHALADFSRYQIVPFQFRSGAAQHGRLECPYVGDTRQFPDGLDGFLQKFGIWIAFGCIFEYCFQ